MARVTLNDVWKTYEGGVDAVRGVSLDIADGEFVVLVGPSGCGKSTTLRMIAGLEDITRGEISIGDRIVNGVEPKNRDIAMVFQNYALYPHMSVYKNMAFALQLRKTPKQEVDRRVRDAADLLGITDLLNRKPKALSGGQRQRVAVGRAIVREPKAFLFDEPLSNLDAKLRVTMRGELKALHRRLGTTTIYVTHDQEEAMTLGDRVVVMAAGETQQADSPLEVYRSPANRFVAGFVGTPPMNFLEGRLEQRDGEQLWVQSGEGPGLVVVRVHDDHRAALAGVERAALGVRPQSIRESSGGEDDQSFTAHIETVELLGEEMDVRLTTPTGAPLTARVRSHHGLDAGTDRAFTIDPRSVCYFAPGEYGESLLAGSLASA